MDQRRLRVRAAAVLLLLVALAFFAVAGYYIATPAGSLFSFMPGHQVGSIHHHVKHGIVAAALGVVVLIAAWFTLGIGKGSARPR